MTEPTLPAEPVNEHHVRAWCRYCDSYHYHGAKGGDDGIGSGHRAPHCWIDDSPYRQGGYVIEVGPPGSAPRPPKQERRRPRRDRHTSTLRHGWTDRP